MKKVALFTLFFVGTLSYQLSLAENTNPAQSNPQLFSNPLCSVSSHWHQMSTGAWPTFTCRDNSTKVATLCGFRRVAGIEFKTPQFSKGTYSVAFTYTTEKANIKAEEQCAEAYRNGAKGVFTHTATMTK